MKIGLNSIIVFSTVLLVSIIGERLQLGLGSRIALVVLLETIVFAAVALAKEE